MSASEGRGLASEQRRGRHDLAGLAVAALRHVVFDPGLLDRVAAVLREALDGGHRLVADGADRDLAGAHRLALEVHGAGAAQRHAAAEFGAREAQRVAQDPEQRGFRIDIDFDRVAIDVELGHERLPRFSATAATICRSRYL